MIATEDSQALLDQALGDGEDAAEAFGQVWRNYQGMIGSYLHGKGVRDVEDAVQDVALAAWQTRQEFRGNSEQVAAWLRGLAQNAIRVAEFRQRPTVPLESVREDDEPEPRLGALEGIEAAWDIRAALSTLTETDRAIYRLHDEGYAPHEIGALLGISAFTVVSRGSFVRRRVYEMCQGHTMAKCGIRKGEDRYWVYTVQCEACLDVFTVVFDRDDKQLVLEDAQTVAIDDGGIRHIHNCCGRCRAISLTRTECEPLPKHWTHVRLPMYQRPRVAADTLSAAA